MKNYLAFFAVLFHIIFMALAIFLPTLPHALVVTVVLSLIGTLLINQAHIEKFLSPLAIILLGLLVIQLICLLFGFSSLLAFALGVCLVLALTFLWWFYPQIFIWVKKYQVPYYAVVLTIAFLCFSSEISLTCDGGLGTDFDSQNYLTWTYTAVKNYLPYKDVLYWYGLFSYYGASSAELRILSVIWKLTLLLLTALTASRFIKSKIILSLFLILFLSLAHVSSNWAAFFRYGTAFALSGASAYFLTRRTLTVFHLFAFGVLSTCIMLLVSDQGIYFVMLLALQIFLINFYKSKLLLKKQIVNFMQSGIWCALGFVSAWIIAAAILQHFGMLSGYVMNIQAMGQLSLFAKVALSELLFSKENIFTTLVLFLGSQLFIYEATFKKDKKPSFLLLVQISWLATLWFCQNKFLIRPWFETQFVFISFALASILISQLLNGLVFPLFTESTKKVLLSASILALFAYLAPDKAILNLFTKIRAQYLGNYSQLIYSSKQLKHSHECLDTYFSNFRAITPNKYLAVMDWISAQTPKIQPLVFSFPGEPIFYILNQQKPPMYFNAYDATALSAQKANIQYLEDNQVPYVIWDIDNLAIQDNVPNVFRNGLVAQFILTHYTAKQLIGSYLIFEHSSIPVDFWQNTLIKSQPQFYESLSHQDLKLYPNLLNLKLSRKNQTSLPEFTSAIDLTVPDTLIQKTLYLKISTANKVPTTVEFFAGESEKATVSITSCYQQEPCLIQLNQLPFFFIPRPSFSINVVTDSSWQAQLVAQ